MSKRVLVYFFLPVVAILLTTFWIYDGYNQLLKLPDTSVTLAKGKQQARKNQLKSSPKTEDARAKIKDADMQSLVAARLKKDQTMESSGIGRLAIPSEKLDLPILNTITELSLSTGAVTYFPERPFGQGNVVLASHNFLDADVLLHRIKNVTKGTKIYLTDFTMVWMYRVVKNQTIRDTQTDVLNQPKGLPIVTLLRCEGGVGTDNRRVVQGVLQATSSFDELTRKQQQMLGVVSKTSERSEKTRTNWMSIQLARSIQAKRPTGWLVLIVLLNAFILGISGILFVRKA